MIVYGIKNCNTVKKGLDWLKANELEFEFHDYKARGISKEKLESWSAQIGWEKLINKKGMTFRKLTDEEKKQTETKEGALAMLMQKTSMIRRPLIERDGKVLALGFDEAEYAGMI